MRRWVVVIAVVLVAGLAGSGNALALSGSGTEGDPWLIQSLADFDEFAADPNYWAGFTRLETDVNLAGRTYSTAVIAPDVNNSSWGYQGTAFTGVFDGNDHKITNLSINGGVNDYLGLFGYIGEYAGEVKNLRLEGGSVSGDRYVGGLVGRNEDGTISNCYSTVSVSGNGHYVGGLVGWNSGGVSNCYSTGDVKGVYYVGGLVGWNSGDVLNCYSTCDVDGFGNVGGLVGSNDYGSISNSYSTGYVTGNYNVAGLVGHNSGSVSNCYSTGDVNGAFDDVGGLVGGNDGSVSNCYSTGDVNGTELNIGGLCGRNYGTASACFWNTEISGLTTSAGGRGLTTGQMKTLSIFQNAGWGGAGWVIADGVDYPRLAWENTGAPPIPALSIPLAGSGTEADPYQIHTAEEFASLNFYPSLFDKHFRLMTDLDVGGLELYPIGDGWNPLAGVFDGNDYVLRNAVINLPPSDYVGLFGYLGIDGRICNLRVLNVSVTGRSYVGGLVGGNSGSVSNCYSTGSVSGDDHVGGLVGGNGRVGDVPDYPAHIINSYSTGNVNGVYSVGGLVGSNKGSISNSYSTGEVTAEYGVGGLVGANGYIGRLLEPLHGWIYNSYSTGRVQGISWFGGLVGYNEIGDIEKSFWDVETSGEPNMCGFQSEYSTGCDPNCGKTTAEMQTKSTFTDAGWDFVEIWLINEGATYPVLRQEIRSDLNNDDSVNMLDLALFASHWLEEN